MKLFSGKFFSCLKWPGIFLLVLSLTGGGLAGCASHYGGGSAGTPQQATTRGEASAKARTELAALYYERGQYGVALEELDVVLQAAPDYAPAYNVRGLVRMALREFKQADLDFRRSLQLDSKDSDAHNNYGWFLCQQGRERESIEHFLAALKNPLYSTPAKAYLNAGVCSKKSGHMQEAGEFLLKALVIQPNMPEALFGLADLAFANGDYAGAKSYFLKFSGFLKSSGLTDHVSAEHLWLAVRIERKLGNRSAENDYAMQLRNRYPDARETQLLLQRQ